MGDPDPHQDINQGVTKPLRATLADGSIQHDAQIQIVDKELPDFGGDGTVIPMRDCWRFNVAAYTIDRNLVNLLVTHDWKVILIDHTRSFTPYQNIRNTEKLTRCSRRLFEALKRLTEPAVAKAVGKHLTAPEVRALLARRDKIVEYFDRQAREKGEHEVFFP